MDLSKTILWFDPGGTTGWCYYNGGLTAEQLVATDKLSYANHYQAGIVNDYNLYGVWPIIEQFKPDIVGFETYRLWASKSDQRQWSDFPEIQIIGAIKLATYQLLGKEPVCQQPSDRAWATDEKLKLRGLYWPIIHMRDATKHVLCHQKFNLGVVRL